MLKDERIVGANDEEEASSYNCIHIAGDGSMIGKICTENVLGTVKMVRRLGRIVVTGPRILSLEL